MRVVVCAVLLSGLLAGLVEGRSVKTVVYLDSQESQESKPQQNGGSFIASQESEERQLWTAKEDPDWTPSKESLEDDRSFIASEETEEGKLWASDDDPDSIPPDSLENDSQDDNTQEDYYDYDTQEDYYDYDTQEDYTQEDQTGEDYTKEVNSQEDQTGEDNSDEDGYFPSPDGDQTFPEVHIPEDPLVVAEYSGGALQHLDDDWSQSRRKEQDYSRVKLSKRDTQRSYQKSQQEVKVPYQDEQDRQDSGTWGAINEGEGSGPGVSTGVEPLLPVGGPQQHEVSAGVEPGGVPVDKDEGTSNGGLLEWGWNMFTGVVGDIGDKVVDTASGVHDKLKDKFSGAVDKIQQTYQKVREGFLHVVARFKVVMKKFGIVVQEGIKYVLRRFDRAIIKAQDFNVIEKLEKALEQGHAEVAKFFQILGEKVQTWSEQHRSENIDEGLTNGQSHGGQQSQQEGQYSQDIEDMPNFLQDPQVVVQLNKLVGVGVLTQDDIIILTEEHVIQDQQNQRQDQHDHQNQDQQDQQQNQQHQQNYQQQSQFNPKFIQFPE